MEIININKKRFSNNFYYVNYDNDLTDIVHLDLLNKYNLVKFKKIGDEEYQEIKSEIDFYFFYDKALKFLERGLKTTKEIKQKLNKIKCDTTIIEKIIVKLNIYNYLNDKYVAERFIEHLIKQNKSLKIIKSKLIVKGIDKHTIEELISSNENLNDLDNQIEVILKLISKKEKKLLRYENRLEKQRYLYQNLSMNGFEYNTIRKAIDIYFKEDSEINSEINIY